MKLNSGVYMINGAALAGVVADLASNGTLHRQLLRQLHVTSRN